MSSRVTNTSIKVGGGGPSVSSSTPKALSSAAITAAGASGHTIEHWGDGTWWDVTANAPISVDKLNLTGTFRSQE